MIRQLALLLVSHFLCLLEILHIFLRLIGPLPSPRSLKTSLVICMACCDACVATFAFLFLSFQKSSVLLGVLSLNYCLFVMYPVFGLLATLMCAGEWIFQAMSSWSMVLNCAWFPGIELVLCWLTFRIVSHHEGWKSRFVLDELLFLIILGIDDYVPCISLSCCHIYFLRLNLR